MYDLVRARPTRVPSDLLAAIEAFEGREVPRRP
jgi:hypothetical protein